MAKIQRKLMVCAYKDGRVETYPSTPGVEMYFERVYRIGLKSAFDGAEGMTNIIRLGWECYRAASNGAVVPNLEDWANTLEAIDVELEDIIPFALGGGVPPSPHSQPQPGSLPTSS